MPALPPVPKVLQLAFGVENNANSYTDINRLYVSYTGTAPSVGSLNAFATTALAAFATALAPSTGDDKTFASLEAVDLSSPTSAVATVTLGTAGALTGAPLPADVAMVMSGTVARRYRGGHPRSYLPVGDVTKLNTDVQWGSDFLTAVHTAWIGFITAIGGAGWAGAGTVAPVNVSYYHLFHNVEFPSGRVASIPSLRVGGPLVDLITAYVARPRLGTQRRRIGR